METDRLRQISRLYREVLARPTEDRAQFLDGACAGDPDLRREVESIFALVDASTGLLERPAMEAAAQLLRETSWPLVGQKLGTYLIGAQIGVGGMGEVYRAHDEKLGRDVAIKILPDRWRADSDRRARFDREARLLAALNHPCIGAIYGVEESEHAHGLVLELVEGPTLDERLANGPLPIRESLTFAVQIAEALGAAHQKGIIHRDLKPANIKIAPNGAVKVLDFGLAKWTDMTPDPAATSVSATVSDLHTWDGAILGTPTYMSPEQTHGLPLDERTDIWSFGCVLYEMLTARVAFPGVDQFERISAIQSREPDWKALPQKTPARVRHILKRCLQKDPTLRPDHIDVVRTEVQRTLSTRSRWPLAAAVIGFVAVGAAGLLRPDSPGGILAGEPRQLTSAPGWEAEPALSPDGATVAYSSNESGDADIWIVDAGGGNPRRLTGDEGSDSRPAWFPDGTSLAFVSERGGNEGVWKVPRSGGPATLMLTDASDPAISPDGSQIAFSRQTPSALRRIAIAPLTDPARARYLTNDQDGLWDHRSPSWSPDGRMICYAARDGLWTVSSSGGKPSALTKEEQFDREPVWSSDGRSVYFASFREGTVALWRVAANGGPPERLTMGTGPERQPSMSRDGARLAYSTLASNSNVVVIDIRTGSEHTLPGERNDIKPTFAPDGRSLVFPSNRWAGRYDLWLQLLSNGIPDGVPRRLTDHAGSANYPTHSPDGRWIAYGRVVDGRRDIWIVSAEGGVPTRVTDGAGEHFHPSWSPDGSRVAFVSQGLDTYRIQSVRISDGRQVDSPTTAVSTPSMPESPVWSPDGSELVFVSGNDIWMAPADGTRDPSRVTSQAGVRRLRWNYPSGRLFASGFWGTDVVSLRLVDIHSGVITSLPFPMVLGRTSEDVDFDISSDQTFAALTRQDVRGDIWVLDSKPRS